MTTFFKVTDRIEMQADYVKTRSGFKHVARIYIGGNKVSEVKICYQNRTWEKFTFESVLWAAVDKVRRTHLQDYATISTFLTTYNEPSPFKSMVTVAKMLDLLGEGQSLKQKNEQKVRIMRARLGEALDLPADWNQLSEQQKADRLEKAFASLA